MWQMHQSREVTTGRRDKIYNSKVSKSTICFTSLGPYARWLIIKVLNTAGVGDVARRCGLLAVVPDAGTARYRVL